MFRLDVAEKIDKTYFIVTVTSCRNHVSKASIPGLMLHVFIIPSSEIGNCIHVSVIS